VAKQTFAMHLYVDTTDDRYVLDRFHRDGDSMLSWLLYVGPVTVDAEVPERFDVRAAKLATKQKELEKVRAEFGAKVTQLQREISELQAIEYVSEA
jgi:hypothetical protein